MTYQMCIWDVALVVSGILGIIGTWRIFRQQGEKTWKAIIPIYSTYVLFKMFDSTKAFWKLFVATIGIIGSYICFFIGLMMGVFLNEFPPYMLLALILLIVSIIFAFVVEFKVYQKISNHYGRGNCCALGMLLFTGVFLFVLTLNKNTNDTKKMF